MNILAIDLGKFNSMCCFFDTNTQEHHFPGSRHNETVSDECAPESRHRSGGHESLRTERLGQRSVSGTGSQDAGLQHQRTWRWKNVKRRTDKDDALSRSMTMPDFAMVAPDEPIGRMVNEGS